MCGDKTGPLDLKPLFATTRSLFFRAAGGGFVLVPKKGSYEVHTQFKPGHRAIVAARQVATYVFNNTTARAITTMVPRTNAPARKLAEKVGFEFSHTDGEWPTPLGRAPLDHFILTRDKWNNSCQQQPSRSQQQPA